MHGMEGVMHAGEGAAHAANAAEHSGHAANAMERSVRGGEGATHTKPPKFNPSEYKKTLLGLGAAGAYLGMTRGLGVDLTDACGGSVDRAFGGGTTKSPPGENAVTSAARSMCNCSIPNSYRITKTMLCGYFLDAPLLTLGLFMFGPTLMRLIF